MAFTRIAGAIALALLATAAFAQANRDGEPMQGQITFGFDGLDYKSGRTASLGSIDATVRLFPQVTLETLATGGTYFGQALGGGAAYSHGSLTGRAISPQVEDVTPIPRRPLPGQVRSRRAARFFRQSTTPFAGISFAR